MVAPAVLQALADAQAPTWTWRLDGAAGLLLLALIAVAVAAGLASGRDRIIRA